MHAPAGESLVDPGPIAALFEGATAAAEAVPGDAYEGVLLGVAAGTGLGLQVEGAPRREIERLFPDGVADIPHAERSAPWDDDLAQTAVVAEALLDAGGTLDIDDLAERLVQWGSENGRGMGGLTYQVLTALSRNEPPSDAAHRVWEQSGRTAAGNGAVMRCAPVALRWRRDPAALVRESLKSAVVTHFDPRCQWSTVAVNVVLALMLNDAAVDLGGLASALERCGAPTEVGNAIRAGAADGLDAFNLDDPASMGYTIKAMQIALWCAGRPADFEDVLVAVVSAGGDTDTNGAVAGAVMGARCGARGIPARWLGNVADADHLRRLAHGLEVAG